METKMNKGRELGSLERVRRAVDRRFDALEVSLEAEPNHLAARARAASPIIIDLDEPLALLTLDGTLILSQASKEALHSNPAPIEE